MRYDSRKWVDCVRYYKRALGPLSPRSVFVYGQMSKDAFYSIAPLSCALHDMGGDLCVRLGRKPSYIFDVWQTYQDLTQGIDNSKTRAMRGFFTELSDKKIEKLFLRPDVVIEAVPEGLGAFRYKGGWAKPFMKDRLDRTASSILKEVFSLKRTDTFGVGFELIPRKEMLAVPLQDYLDSYQISFSVYGKARDIAKSISVSSSSRRDSILDAPERVSDLMAMLLGLELSKDIDEPVFRAYKRLSDTLNLKRIEVNTATFAISGKGYPGRHYFGEKAGYPTPDRKSRWSSPGGIIYQFPWNPQSHVDSRPPRSRIGFTQTVPIDIFVKSVDVDYAKMRRRNRKIADILKKCERVHVKSKGGSDFEVGLVGKDGKRREVKRSDSDVRSVVNKDMLKSTGKSFGMMANIPGGEAFVTPEYVKGRIVGDVVIEIDHSHVLSHKEPLVVEADKEAYRIVSGPKDVISEFRKKKREAWKRILLEEKNGSIPKEIIDLKKANFEKIGEFAINTNPNATLCDYLIVNEKIANMIHVAFGSGFEADRTTEYHMDVVIDSPRQKLDIYGIDANGKERWIIRKGRFVV